MTTGNAYYEATARGITPETQAWLAELEERFGEQRVIAAIRAEAPQGNPGKLLGRVRDRLVREDVSRSSSHPNELTREQLLGVVRGELAPTGPFIYDTRELNRDEYDEVLAWSSRRLGHG